MHRSPAPARLPRRFALAALVVACTIAAAAATFSAASASERPHKKLKGPLPVGPVASAVAMTPSWELPVSETSAPYVVGAGESFVVMTRAGRMAAHLPGASEPLWRVDLGSPVETAPVFSSGRLVVVTREGGTAHLLLIDAATGSIVSRQSGGSAAPIVSATQAGFAIADPSAGSSSLALLDPRTGAIRWKTPLPNAPSAAAAQCGDALLVGGADGALRSLGVPDGSIRWTERIDAEITTPVLCDGHRAWVGSADNRLHALKVRKRGCRRRWSYLTGGDISGRIVQYGARVLFFSYDTYLYALEAGNGHLAWKVRLGRRPQADSVLIGDLLLVAPLNAERIEAFHLPDGAQTAALSLPGGKDRFVTPPARAAGMVVIAAARYGEESARVIGLDPFAAGKPAAAPPR